MTTTPSVQVILIVLEILAFVPAIVLHECAHGFAAYKLGDPTAKRAGRITLNPIAHIDPFGTVILPGILLVFSALSGGGGLLFGYAKPVPYNPRNFDNIRQGELIVGLAGPVSNLVMSVIGAAIAWGAGMIGDAGSWAFFLYYFGEYFCIVNLCLAFFNLIPIPPLDGSSIIAVFLTDNGLRTYYMVQQYAMFILLMLIFVVPYICNVDILNIYLQATAGKLANLMLP